MLVLGHRGAPERHLENTLASFRAAMELGADGVELDVRRTADGHLVVHHDAKLPGHSEAIEQLTLDTVREARLSDGQQVPTLTEVLEAIGPKARVVVELKGRSKPGPLALVLGPSEGRPGLCVSSFNHRMVASACAKSYPVALTVDRDPHGSLDKAERLGARELHVRHNLIDPAFVAAARSRGLKVIAWTVDTTEEFARLSAAGADGIITNRVETALGFFRKNRSNNRGTA